MRKHTLIIVGLVFTALFLVPHVALAQADYVPLVSDIPGVTDRSAGLNLETFLQGMFNLLIGVAAGLAVIMIIIGGIQKLSTDSVFKQDEGRKKVSAAIGGLILAIVSYAILYTINPNILGTNPTESIQGNDFGVIQSDTTSSVSFGRHCYDSISQSTGREVLRCFDTKAECESVRAEDPSGGSSSCTLTSSTDSASSGRYCYSSISQSTGRDTLRCFDTSEECESAHSKDPSGGSSSCTLQ